MEFNIDIRRKQLNSLDQFIKSSKENFDSILKTLNWSEDAVAKEDSWATCTVNPEHKIPSNSLEKHVEACSLRQESYFDSTPLLSEPLHHKLASIHLSKDQRMEMFTALKNHKEFKAVWNSDKPDPKSADRFYCTYSPDERRVMYDHCVASTIGPKNLPDFNVYKLYKSTNDGVHLTVDEERARERDLKRRSFKYKKTYTSRDRDPLQVMRDVINGQMELYSEWLMTQEQNSTELCKRADVDTGYNNDRKDHPKGPRTPEHEAPPDDEAVDYNGNGHYDDVEKYARKDSNHSSRSRTIKRDRSCSPRRRQSSHDCQQQPHRRRYSSRTHSQSRSSQCSSTKRLSQQHNSTHNHSQQWDSDRVKDRLRDKRKPYSSRHNNGSERRREGSRSRSPRASHSRR